MKRIPLFIILLAIVGAGVYVFFNRATLFQGAPEKIKVRLGWVHQAQFAGFYVAKEKGFYKKAGLDVELLELDESVNQVEELGDGETDFSIMEAHQLLVGVDSGVDLVSVMAVYQINPHVLAVRQDSGITGPKDFDGKVIGLAGGEGEGNALFRIFVERFGDVESVTYKNLGFDTVGSFVNQEADVIDLYRIDQPYLAQQRGVPLTIIPLDAYGFSTYGDVVAAKQTIVQGRPETVRNFVKATLQGWEYALSNPQEAVEITMRYTSGDYHNAEYQQHILQESALLIRGESSMLGRMELVPWSTLYESMRRAGALKQEFNLRDIYTNEFVN